MVLCHHFNIQLITYSTNRRVYQLITVYIFLSFITSLVLYFGMFACSPPLVIRIEMFNLCKSLNQGYYDKGAQGSLT